MSEPTIVLLHGAGVGPWVWERALAQLPAGSLAPALNARSADVTPTGCASGIVRELDQRGVDRVVLVLHSLAGVLAGELASALPGRLAACIYVAAVAPQAGSTFAKTLGFPVRLLLPMLFRLHPRGLKPSEAMLRKELCTGLDDATCRELIGKYEAEYAGLYLSAVPGVPSVPSAYIALSRDQSVPLKKQLEIARRIADATVLSLDAGHMAMLSHPHELATRIKEYTNQLR